MILNGQQPLTVEDLAAEVRALRHTSTVRSTEMAAEATSMRDEFLALSKAVVSMDVNVAEVIVSVRALERTVRAMGRPHPIGQLGSAVLGVIFGLALGLLIQ